jgi:hypothetical protein
MLISLGGGVEIARMGEAVQRQSYAERPRIFSDVGPLLGDCNGALLLGALHPLGHPGRAHGFPDENAGGIPPLASLDRQVGHARC